MAIKPTDNIIWLDDVGYYKDEPDWHGHMRPVYHYPTYWVNFCEAATKHLTLPKPTPYQSKSDISRMHAALPKKKTDAIKDRLKQYNAEFKESRNGPYLKFKEEAQIMLFMIRWS